MYQLKGLKVRLDGFTSVKRPYALRYRLRLHHCLCDRQRSDQKRNSLCTNRLILSLEFLLWARILFSDKHAHSSFYVGVNSHQHTDGSLPFRIFILYSTCIIAATRCKDVSKLIREIPSLSGIFTLSVSRCYSYQSTIHI